MAVQGDTHAPHEAEYSDLASLSVFIDSPWSAWREVVARHPWRSLKHLDLNGRISCRVLQVIVAEADLLETLTVTNWPNEMVAGGMAFEDSWVGSILEANSLPNLREFTLRMDSDHYVEEGFLTKASLAALLQHAVVNCPRLEKVVGEWTKVPDREIAQLEEEAARKGLPVKVRNAEPYREFQSSEDNDRYYGMNEGYWRNLAVNPVNLPAGQQGLAAASQEEIHFRHRRLWGYVYRPYKSEPADLSS